VEVLFLLKLYSDNVVISLTLISKGQLQVIFRVLKSVINLLRLNFEKFLDERKMRKYCWDLLTLYFLPHFPSELCGSFSQRLEVHHINLLLVYRGTSHDALLAKARHC
jgi:hypothetical protein